jgi:putative tRNA adenosine deaminase-associated protein
MSDGTVSDDTLTDFALAVSRDEGQWDVVALPPHAAHDLDLLVGALTQLQAELGVLGLVSVADEFFVALRVRGEEVSLMLSDPTAAWDWQLARDVLDELDLPIPDPEDDDDADADAVGDLDLFEDLGISALEMSAICSDVEQFPDEMVARIAARLGFADRFEAALADKR